MKKMRIFAAACTALLLANTVSLNGTAATTGLYTGEDLVKETGGTYVADDKMFTNIGTMYRTNYVVFRTDGEIEPYVIWVGYETNKCMFSFEPEQEATVRAVYADYEASLSFDTCKITENRFVGYDTPDHFDTSNKLEQVKAFTAALGEKGVTLTYDAFVAAKAWTTCPQFIELRVECPTEQSDLQWQIYAEYNEVNATAAEPAEGNYSTYRVEGVTTWQEADAVFDTLWMAGTSGQTGAFNVYAEYEVPEGGMQLATEQISLTNKTLYGDVNADAQVDITDAVHLAKAAAGQVELGDEQFRAADVNQDKGVDTNDQILLLKFLIGTIKTLPV